MKVLNFGSLNVDYVYMVDHIVEPGETVASALRTVCTGGKGLNQSVALAKAGVEVFHAGCMGTDGDILLDTLKEAGVHTDYICRMNVPGGHTIIQVDKKGENSIIVYGGTNKMISRKQIDSVLSKFDRNDYLLLQNEINDIPYIMDAAYEKGMNIVLNPSPINQDVLKYPLHKAALFVLNEIEGKCLAETDGMSKIIPRLSEKYPNAGILLTLGREGSIYSASGKIYRQGIFQTKTVDTTGAGDTYLGYFLYGILSGMPMEKTMKIAAKAASMAVSIKGAAVSIPTLEGVLSVG